MPTMKLNTTPAVAPPVREEGIETAVAEDEFVGAAVDLWGFEVGIGLGRIEGVSVGAWDKVGAREMEGIVVGLRVRVGEAVGGLVGAREIVGIAVGAVV